MDLKLFLTSKIWQEGKYYIAYNPELEVASQGKTAEEAEAMLKKAISLFIDTAKKIRTLNTILEEAGFVKKEKTTLRVVFGKYRQMVFLFLRSLNKPNCNKRKHSSNNSSNNKYKKQHT